jgi:hypothetical protein
MIPIPEKRKLNSTSCCAGIPVAGEIDTDNANKTALPVRGGTKVGMTIQIE